MTLIPLFTGRSNFNATGGTTYTQGGYKYHKFTSSGSFTVVSGTRTLEYLIVGGGGAGGTAALLTGTNYSYGGGGGAGGLVNGSCNSANLTITVGVGGVPKATEDGGFSRIAIDGGSTITAIGGGAGAKPSSETAATTGGSGGGRGLKKISGTLTSYASAIGTPFQGNSGGNYIDAIPGSGGGGGRGGGAVSSGGTGPTDGGAGSTAYSSWFDTGGSVVAAGGFGGQLNSGRVKPTDFGCGGPGGAYYASVIDSAFAGSDGIVIIRYTV